MNRRKTLQELTITDSFLFAAVMMEPENCKRLLELVLGMPIGHVKVITEKSMAYHPEYKGVRLDVYAKDDKNSRFNVEMQVKNKPVIKRSRYYHSQIDMDVLKTGAKYNDLPDCYVIFICDFDPFGGKKYCYTLNTTCKEMPNLKVDDGVHTIILSNRGENDTDILPELVNFLKFTRAPIAECEYDTEDAYIAHLQESIRAIKNDRLMEDKFMVLEALLQDERKEAHLETWLAAVIQLLEKHGQINEDIYDMLYGVDDEQTFSELLSVASNVNSIEEFKEQMTTIVG